MLIKLLPESERGLLLDLCKLLTLSDNPLLWDGQPYDKLTSESDLSALMIMVDEQESDLLTDLEHTANCESKFRFGYRDYSKKDVEFELTEKLKSYPITQVNQPVSRAAAAIAVQRKLLEGQSSTHPERPKIMLYELLLVALKDGSISSVEMALLKEFQQHYQLPDYLFDDLLVRAEALNNELSRTLAIILE